MTLADQFSEIFREEHRQVRDALLDMIVAFRERDRTAVQGLLGRVAALAGPHFRYEEEALYPSLEAIFGAEYIEKLLADHDRVIGTAAGLVAMAGQGALDEADAATAVRHVRAILPHVSDCDGLSLMVERLPEAQIRAVLSHRDRAREADLDLLRWSGEVRTRPAVPPQ